LIASSLWLFLRNAAAISRTASRMLCGGSWIVFILDGLLLMILSSFFPGAAVLLPFIYYFLEKQLVKA
jgi:hypothetical protein